MTDAATTGTSRCDRSKSDRPTLVRRTARSGAALALACAASLGAMSRADAQEFYIGDIMLVGFNFCPRGTVPTEGQLLAINQFQALFSLYGTTYGGDGRTTFELPDLRGAVPKGPGQRPGGPITALGERGGTEFATLTEPNLPPHSHAVNATNADGDSPGPGDKVLAAAPPGGTGAETIYSTQPPNRTMSAEMIGPTGDGQAFSTVDPYTVLRYCVVIDGLFPSRN